MPYVFEDNTPQAPKTDRYVFEDDINIQPYKPALGEILNLHSKPHQAVDTLRRAIANGVALDMPLNQSIAFDTQIEAAKKQRGISATGAYHQYQIVQPEPIPDDAGKRTLSQELAYVGNKAMRGLTYIPKAIGEFGSLPGRALGIGGGIWDEVYRGAKEAQDYWQPKVGDKDSLYYVGEAIEQAVAMGADILLTQGAATTQRAAAAEGLSGLTSSQLSSLSLAIKNTFKDLGKSPLMLMGARSGLDKQREIDEEGYPLYKSLIGGLVQAGLEITTEKGPLDELLKPGHTFLTRLTKGLVKDIPGELVATAGEMAAIDSYMLGKVYTKEQYFEALKDTAIIAGLMTGGATTAIHPFVQQPPAVKAVYDGVVEGMEAQGYDKETARAAATAMIAQTQDGVDYLQEVNDVIVETAERVNAKTANPEDIQMDAFIDTVIGAESADAKVDDAAIEVLFDRMSGQDGPHGKGEGERGVGEFVAQRQKADRVFITSSDGTIDFGKITEDIASEIGHSIAPIRLEIGNGDYGEIHIEKDKLSHIQKAGFPDVKSFVEFVGKNFNQIWQQPNGRLMLVKRNGRADLAVVELQKSEEGDYYGVSTAFPADVKYLATGDRKLLWERSIPISAISGLEAPLADTIPESVQGEDAWRSGQSNIIPDSSISLRSDEVKPGDYIFNEDGSVDLGSVVEIGNAVWSDGYNNFKDFTARMKDIFGNLWQKVKSVINQVWEQVKAFNEQLGEGGYIGKPEDVTRYEKMKEVGPKSATKSVIREETGQKRAETMIPETQALKAAFKKAAQAAKVAYKEGNIEGVAAQKAIMKEALQKAKEQTDAKIAKIQTYKQKTENRRRKIADIRDTLGLNDADLKKITRANPVLMSDAEFKKFADDVYIKAVELAETTQAKAELMDLIYTRRLKKVDNYREALSLPPITQMNKAQLNQFLNALEPFQDGDVFIGKREIETVDRTELAGIRTWREAKEKLAAKLNVPIEVLSSIKVSEFDAFRWDTSLAEQNIFYGMMVQETTQKILEANLRYHEVESRVYELAKKSEKSKGRSLLDKAIPRDKQIFDYIEAPAELKQSIAKDMTPEQLDFANYIQEYYSKALEYLIKTKSLQKGRENYFVHMRKTFFEAWRDDGFKEAARNLFKNYEQDQYAFNILDEDTGNILPLEKFFQYSLRRTGELAPTNNVTRAFLSYAQTFEKKVALDSLIPALDIYAQALTPETYTPRGLETDRSLKKFVYEYINNKKGRRITFAKIKQGGKIDTVITALRTFTSLLDLGFNLPVGIASMAGEQVANLEMLGAKGYALGTARMRTAKGKAILSKYQAYTDRGFWENFTAPGKVVTERLVEGMFGLFHVATTTANKQFLLGSLTQQEYDNGEISPARLAELKTEMGRFRVVPGTSSLVGSTSIGASAVQYKKWAVPIMRTLTKDITVTAKALKNKPIGEALTAREAKEIYRMISMTSVVLIAGSMFIDEDDDDDNSFTGELVRKVYRESMTLLQGVDPKLWVAIPRTAIFLKDLGDNLHSIVLLEEYTSKDELKGVSKLQKQLTPRVIKSITEEE